MALKEFVGENRLKEVLQKLKTYIDAKSGVSGVKGSAESSYRTGNVNITSGNIGLGNVGNYKAVSTVANQGLSATEQANARANIGAGTSSFSGSYNDLSNKPTIPAAQVNSDWNATSGVAQILNKPTIPTVNNGQLTIQRNGTQIQTFSANQSGNVTANLQVPSGNYYGTCTGQAANQVKVVTIAAAQNFELKAGATIAVKFDANNTYSATAAAPVQLDVNNTGAKAVYGANSAAPTGTNTTYFGRANYINSYVYDGTYWVWQGSSADNNTTYSAMSESEATTGTATTARTITAAVLDKAITNKGYTKNTGTVTSVATGAGLTGGTITGSGTIKADLKSETKSTLEAAAKGTTASREYAVGLDKNGNLSVNVPWTNTTKGNGITTNAAQTGSFQSNVVSTIAANTTMDAAIKTLLNNDATLDNHAGNIDSAIEGLRASCESLYFDEYLTGLRFQNLGTSFTSGQQAALSSGDLRNFWNGDYWVINGITWRIVDNTGIFRRRGDTNFDKPSLVIMPDTNLIGAEAFLIDNANDSGHGYANCAYRTRTDGKGRAQCKTIIANAFGASHIASHRELMSTTRTSADGATGWAWQDADVELPTEMNIYGGNVWSKSSIAGSGGHNVGDRWGQFMLFRLASYMAINQSQSYWLRDISGSSYFADVNPYGAAYYHTPSNAYVGVRPLFILI